MKFKDLDEARAFANDMRGAIDAFNGSQTQAEEPLPMPSQAPPNLKPEEREKLFEGWVNWIYSRKSETWTPEEREVIRVACDRALRTLNEG